MIPTNYYDQTVSDIKVRFDLPDEWEIVTPWVNMGTYHQVPRITRDLTLDLTARTGIYFGKMRMYAETEAGACKMQMGLLESDSRWYTARFLPTQQALESAVERNAEAVRRLAEVFGENPYPAMPISDTIEFGEWIYPKGAGILGGIQFWPEKRLDEAVGHLVFSWMWEICSTPLETTSLICKGIGEMYLGNKIAYEMTGDAHYLGKLYACYLVYKGALGTEYYPREGLRDAHFRGAVLGMYLDELVQQETGGSKSLVDVIRYLYENYKHTGVEVGNSELEEAVGVVTGQDNSSVFRRYVNGDEEIPVQGLIDRYRDGFDEFVEILQTDYWGKQYNGYMIPFFVDVEMAIRFPEHLPAGILCEGHYKDFADYVLSNYNLAKLTTKDAEEVLTLLCNGEDCTGFFTRWADSYGDLSLDEMKEWLSSYLPGGPKRLALLELCIGKPLLKVGQSHVDLDSPPVIKNDRTLVPIRAIIEALGGAVSWRGAEQKVTVTLNGRTIEMWIGRHIAEVNGVGTDIDPADPEVVPEIIRDRTMLPLRFVAEHLGANVYWDPDIQTVLIAYLLR